MMGAEAALRGALGVGLVAFVVLSLGQARAQPGEGVVEATGEASITDDDEVAAKKLATADALRKCVEQVVGVYVQNEFSSEQREVVQRNQNEFYAKVQDSVLQKSEGFIQRYVVTGHSRQGNIMRVTVQAHVFETKLRAEAKKFADLMAAAGNPKLMLVVQDVFLAADGSRRVSGDSVLAAYLEKELLARGFELQQSPQAKALAQKSVHDYDKWFADATKVAEMARKYGADLVIAGRVEIRNKGVIEDTGGFAALKGQTRIELTSLIRGVNAASGEVFSSEPVQMTSIGTNQERALHRAFRGRGANLVQRTFDALAADLKASFQRAAEQGQSYAVHLRGVKSFRREGQKFLDVLQAVSGVSSVKQRAFNNGELHIDVACKCSSSELQSGIFAVVDGADGLTDLDIEGVSGKQLTFRL